MIIEIADYSLNLLLIIGLNVLWYIPIRHLLKHPFWVFLAICLIEYICAFLFLPYPIEKSANHGLLIQIAVLVPVFFIGKQMAVYDWVKSVCLFLWATASTSFFSAFAHTITIVREFFEVPPETPLFKPILALSLCGISILVLFIITKFIDLGFLTDPNVPSIVWYAFLPIPVFIFHQNILHIAASGADITTDQELYAQLMMLVGNLLLFIVLTATFCYVAIMYVRNARVLEEKQMLELQQSQYNELVKNVERTNKLLHDFKHTVNTLRGLAAEGNGEEILAYLDEMDEALPSGTNIMNYCTNIAVNSILNHYAFRSSQENVPLNLQVNLPDEIPISDPELCSMIGNLMENAIDACRVLPEDERRFDLSIVMKGNILYIISSNTFDGRLETSGDEYISTKHDGFGIGIRSIRETVERYGGTLKIYSKVNEFFADILISFYV